MKAILRCAWFVALATAAQFASAQTYPDHAVRIIVPFPAGATMDAVVRLIGEKLGAMWHQPVIVENRTGAAGLIGTASVAKAAPDGYTILAVANSFAANPTLRSSMPYDTAKDFTPITLIGSTPLVLVATSSLPVASTSDLVAMAKQEPGRVSYGAAAGASPHLAMAWFESVTGTRLLFVPYRGQAQAQTDLIGGQVKLAFGNLPDILPLVKAGQLKALGITTPARSPLAPEIPTLSEAGYKGPAWDSWYGFVAPTGTPLAIVDKFAADVRKILTMPDVKEDLGARGIIVVADTPSEFDAFLKQTSDDYAKIIRQAHIHVD